MLRRVTPDQVAVFVATSASFTAQLHVRQAGSTSSGDWRKSPSQTPVSLGGALHVLVITLTPPTALTVDLVYEYDVQFTVASGVKVRTDAGDELPGTTRTFGLTELGLLAGTLHVGLSAGAFPSFAIQSSKAKLRLIHGSCRKPHGGGDDAMPFITELFGPNAATSASDRPHYLLLTGDQIYADDVSTSLLWLLQETGKEFMDPFTEELTLPTWPGGKVSFPGVTPETAEQSAGKKRQRLMDNFNKVSSDHKESHLVFLAEFYAMYVLVWSPALWGWGWFVKWNPTSGFPSPASLARDEYDNLEEDNTWPSEEVERHKAVRYFAQGTSKVRRVLANVSTLMMFDDHEVSDDWNLDATWKSDSRSDPMVHRIVRNALLAFAAFQAWGNDPARFASGTAGRKLLNAANPNASSADNVFQTPDCVDGLLRLGDFNASLPPSEKQPILWHWAIDQDDYRILALDTRTRREYDIPATQKETGLLDSAAMADQLPVEDIPPADDKVTFVLSPAPVLGHPLLEEVVLPLYKAIDNARAADAEAWSLSRASLVALLHRLSRYGRVVLLSGDVHYAYSNYTDFLTRNEGGSSSSARSARFVQLCSSALHNQEGLTLAVEEAGLVGMGERRWSGRQFDSYADHKVRIRPNENLLTIEARLETTQDFDALGPVEIKGYEVVDRVVTAAASGKLKNKFTLENLLKGALRSRRLGTLIRAGIYIEAPEKLTNAYFTALGLGVPGIPNAGIGVPYSLTLPTGPWLSADLREAIKRTLPLPTTNDTAWTWTWTTTFASQSMSTGGQPPVGVARLYDQGKTAKKREIVGRPNFGEITVEGLPVSPQKLWHRIHWIDADRRRRVTVIHEIPDLSPLSVTRPWPAVY